jgi:hypothetical protein
LQKRRRCPHAPAGTIETGCANLHTQNQPLTPCGRGLVDLIPLYQLIHRSLPRAGVGWSNSKSANLQNRELTPYGRGLVLCRRSKICLPLAYTVRAWVGLTVGKFTHRKSAFTPCERAPPPGGMGVLSIDGAPLLSKAKRRFWPERGVATRPPEKFAGG